MNSDDYEWGEYDQPLKGIERFRDDFQVMYTADRFTEEYAEAKKNVWKEMEAMYRNEQITKVDQVKIQRCLEKNRKRKAYRRLEQVLENNE